jgi:hypothetical protein
MHPVAILSEIQSGSRETPYPAEFLLANNTATRMRVLWVDRIGITHDYGLLEPYSRRILQSYTSQTWLIENPASSSKLLIGIKDSESELLIDGPLRTTRKYRGHARAATGEVY